eukprot:178514_1
MAKNVILAVLFILLCIGNANVHLLEDHTHNYIRCGTDEYIADKIASDAQYKHILDEMETNYQAFLKHSNKMESQSGPWNGNDVLEIPVVLHIIWNTQQQNINYEQIISQMVVMNQDFMKLNEDWINTPEEWIPIVGNFSMVYKLSEIRRVETYVEFFDLTDSDGHYIDAMKRSIDGGSDYVPGPVLNIWICQVSVLGYATWPGYPKEYDGAVILTEGFGSIKYDYSNSWTLLADYDLGRTATHEIGHYLWLAHVWGDGDCEATDYVEDTPQMEGPSFGCPYYPQYSCESTDMTMNYMDVVDDECYSMFTNGQFLRSASLMFPGGARQELMEYTNDNILPFVASIYFEVGDNVNCGPTDYTVQNSDGSILNLNEGHDHIQAPFIKACISKTINKYVVPIIDIEVVIGSECSMSYYINTNLNYGVITGQIVHVCFEKGTDINGPRITDVKFFSFDQEQTDVNYDGYTLILRNVNAGFTTPSYIYLGYKRTESVVYQVGDRNMGDSNSWNLSHRQSVIIYIACIILLLVLFGFIVYYCRQYKSNAYHSMSYEMTRYGTNATE